MARKLLSVIPTIFINDIYNKTYTKKNWALISKTNNQLRHQVNIVYIFISNTVKIITTCFFLRRGINQC